MLALLYSLFVFFCVFMCLELFLALLSSFLVFFGVFYVFLAVLALLNSLFVYLCFLCFQTSCFAERFVCFLLYLYLNMAVSMKANMMMDKPKVSIRGRRIQ